MTLDKLKVAARQHELRSEWRAAIDLYRQAIRSTEADTGSADPGLFNRIGDLEQQAGDTAAACEAWEHAATRYSEQGFFNNAIALSTKILRTDPSRTRAYLELARFHGRKRVIYDVRQNLTVYHQQMESHGQGAAAAAAIDEFAQEFASWRELRDFINGLLGRESAAVDGEGEASETEKVPSDLVFLDIDAKDDTPLVIETSSLAVEVEPVAAAMEGLEVHQFEDIAVPGDGTAGGSVVGEALELERTGEEEPIVAPMDGLEGTSFEAPPVDDSEARSTLEGLEVTVVELEAAPAEADPEFDRGAEEATADMPEGISGSSEEQDQQGESGGSDGLVFIAEPSIADALADVVAAVNAGGDPLDERAAAEELIQQGDREGGVAALERALEQYLAAEDLGGACRTAQELVAAEPWSHARRQQWVEVAARSQDGRLLVPAYAALGELLERDGMQDKAVAIYRRILELEEGHVGARAALRRMVPDAPQEIGEDGFIDFGAMVNDDIGPRSTRMRTETTAVSPDEDETFREALAEFKRALDQNLPVEDHQTHYDLGLAFKEMGLLDEAVGEFQKALRSPEGRLRTSESLGEVFYLQGRPAVAEAVLRAVDRGDEDDASKVGVLYWLGRSLEVQGKGEQARGCYERVMAVDVSFADVVERLTGLGDGSTG